MGGTLLKLRTWWEIADRTTKTVTLVGGGLLIALLMGVFYFSSSPDMKQLFAGLEPTEQGRVVQKLQELKVPYKQETDGSIYIPGAQLAETRARLAQDGIPSAGSMGNLRLDKSSFSDTEQIQNEKVRVALEEEMQKTIEAISAISSAKVHIAPGNDSPFASEQTEPSASVLVQLNPGATSARSVADVIVRLMAGAVRGLKPANISVSDSNGIVLWNGESDEGGSGVATKKREAELAESDRLTRALDAMITRTVGPGKAVVSANVEMNFDKESVVTNGDQPTKDPISKQSVTETMGADSSRPGAGGAATIGGTPAAPGAAASSTKGYTMSQEVVNNGVTQLHSEKSVAPGAVKSVRISIMLDDSAKAAQKQITDFASNLIGAVKDPDNFSVAVTSVAFDKTAATNATKELVAAKSGQMMQQAISLLPVIALIVVGFLVMKSIGKAAGNNRNVLAAVGGIQPLAIRGGGGGGYAVTQHGGGDHASLPPPEELQLSDAARSRRDAIRRTMRPDVDDIPEKFDVNLEQILKMADQRPESVALLLKSWLLEEV